MRYRIYTIALAFIACVTATTSAQTDFVAPEDEAPAALLNTSLGSADVSLFLAGFWESELSGSIGLLHDGSDLGLRPAPFPGMIQGYSFRQTPDLTIYLLIDDRFSFEASFLDG